MITIGGVVTVRVAVSARNNLKTRTSLRPVSIFGGEDQYTETACITCCLNSTYDLHEKWGDYHIFCAFKCIHNISKEELKSIEEIVLSILDRKFINEHGVTKRVRHFESNTMSECFYYIDFMEILYAVHFELYDKHSRYFSSTGLFDNDENDLGDVLDCEFNRKISIEKAFEYRKFISQ